MLGAMGKMASEEGIIGAFYSGFGPILAKQVPYTMAKFAVQGIAAEKIYDSLGKTPAQMSSGENISVSLASGVVAGVVAAIISHPADTLLSKINKAGAGGSGGMLSRLANIAAETGLVKLCTQGLGARCVMIGTLTAGQFGIFDIVMNAVGASKFHFHDPPRATPTEREDAASRREREGSARRAVENGAVDGASRAGLATVRLRRVSRVRCNQ